MRRNIQVVMTFVSAVLVSGSIQADDTVALTAEGILGGGESVAFGKCTFEPGDTAQIWFEVDREAQAYLELEGVRQYAAITSFGFVVRRGGEAILEYSAQTPDPFDPELPTGHLVKMDKEAGAPYDGYFLQMIGLSADICDLSENDRIAFELILFSEEGGDLIKDTELGQSLPRIEKAHWASVQLRGDRTVQFEKNVALRSGFDDGKTEVRNFEVVRLLNDESRLQARMTEYQ